MHQVFWKKYLLQFCSAKWRGSYFLPRDVFEKTKEEKRREEMEGRIIIEYFSPFILLGIKIDKTVQQKNRYA